MADSAHLEPQASPTGARVRPPARPTIPPPHAAEVESGARELYERSGAAQYEISLEAFCAVVAEVAAKYLPPRASSSEARQLVATLRVEELVLARACAAGHEHAWEVFLTRFREKLYGAAYSIAKEDSAARELADSLYASLYGMTQRDGRRVSKLSSYMGRGSLEGWLRTVLAQEFVNRYRTRRRLVSLEEEEEAGVQFQAPQRDETPTADPRLAAATDDALAALEAEDRYVLASYFLDGSTLAEVAKTLRVHESTISRRVEKITKNLRKAILEALVRRGLSRRAAEEALESDIRDLGVDVRTRLAAGGRPQEGKARP